MTSAVDQLERVLDRSEHIRSVRALRFALARRGSSSSSANDLSRVAFGLDSNVVLRMAKADPTTTDLRDYLAASHAGPLVLPGQVVQEFWNNTVAVVDTVSQAVRKRYDALAKELPKTDVAPDLHEQFSSLLEQFENHYGHLLDPKTAERFSEFWDMMEDRAIVTYVPRSRFERLVHVRNSTKTPPGFKDSGDGDFYVWADFLLGLLNARDRGVEFDSAVLITQDVKLDWSSGGVAHPILIAEVDALLGIPFETWTLDRFQTAFRTSQL